MTTDNDLRRLALAARDATAVFRSASTPEGLQAADEQRDHAFDAMRSAIDPDDIIRLLDAAAPVEGEFGEQLERIILLTEQNDIAAAACARSAARVERDALIASLTRAHAALVAERDALRFAVGEHVRAREKAEHIVEILRGEMSEARAALAKADAP